MNNKNSCNCNQSSEKTLKKETNVISSCGNNEKSEGCNQWTSVAENYNIDESSKKNPKSATNNQWCSCSK